MVAANNDAPGLVILRQDVPGHFVFDSLINPHVQQHGIAIGDVNGNGVNDVLVAGFFSLNRGWLDVALNGFSSPYPPESLGSRCTYASIGDADGDSYPDLVFVGQDSTLFTFHGDSSADGLDLSFQTTATIPFGSTYAKFCDLDVDGHSDLVIANYESGSISIFWGSVGGLLSPPEIITVGNHPNWLVVAPIDGDSLPDLVVANRDDDDVWFLHQDFPRVFCRMADVAMPGGPTNLVSGQFEVSSPLLDLVVTCGDSSRVVTLGHALSDVEEDGGSLAPRTWTARLGPSPGSVRLELQDAAPVELSVFDPAGRLLSSRDFGDLQPGEHTLSLGPRRLGSGVVFLRLRVAGGLWTSRAVVIR